MGNVPGSVRLLLLAAVASLLPRATARAQYAESWLAAEVTEAPTPIASSGSGDARILSGASTYSVPIPIPPGRRGVAPTLELAYDSGRRETSSVGVGWDIPISYIQRSTKYGVDYAARDFAYVSNGSLQHLVRWPGHASCEEYRLKIDDGSFLRFCYSPPPADTWVMYNKDGTAHRFGQAAASRVADPADASRVFRWLMDRVEDRVGDYYTLSYTSGAVSQIDYSGNSLTGALPTNQVTFKYVDNEAALLPSLPGDFPLQTPPRLTDIWTKAGTATASHWKLDYGVGSTGGPILSAASNRLLLRAIHRYGATGAALPDISLGWYEQAPALKGTTVAPGTQLVGLVDWTGNADQRLALGSSSTIRDNSGNLVGRSLKLNQARWDQATRSFAEPVSWTEVSGYFADANAPLGPARIGDFDGDGVPDIAYPCGVFQAKSLCIHRGSRSSGELTLGAQEIWGDPIGFGDPSLGADFDGDGATDFLTYNSGSLTMTLHLSCGGATACSGRGFRVVSQDYTPSTAELVTPATWRPLAVGNFLGTGRSSLAIADCNRPVGTVKLVTLDAAGTSLTESGWTPLGYPTGRMCDNESGGPLINWVFPTAMDVNSDGRDEIVIVSDKNARAWVYAWSRSSFIELVFPWVPQPNFHDSPAPHDSIDIYNRGGAIPELWSLLNNWVALGLSVPLRTRVSMFPDGVGLTAVLTGGGSLGVSDTDRYPDLLASVANGTGGVTRFDYTPSSRYPNTFMPFVIPVVSAISVDDGSKHPATTQYAYRGGIYDRQSREFKGFGQVDVTAPDGGVATTIFWPPLEANGDLARRVRSVTQSGGAKAGNDAIQVSNTWVSTSPGAYPTFVRLTESRSTTTHAGATTLVSTTSYGYDDRNGALRTVTNAPKDGPSTTTTVDWKLYDGAYVWRATAVTLSSGGATIRKRALDHYAGSGLLKSVTFIGDDLVTGPTTTYTYDADGTLATVVDPRGARTVIAEYDASRTYAARVEYQDHIGAVLQRVSTSYDPRFGQLQWIIDANGNQTCYPLDDFGRSAGEYLFAGTVQTAPGACNLSVRAPLAASTVHRDDTSKLIRTTRTSGTTAAPSTIEEYSYLDGLGRVIQEASPVDSTASWAITRRAYDWAGRVVCSDGPFLNASPRYGGGSQLTAPLVTVSYDELGRVQSELRVAPPATGATPVSGFSCDRVPAAGPGTAVTRYAYDGLVTTITDPDGKRRSMKQDGSGNTVAVTEFADGGAQLVTKYAYGPAGDLAGIIDSHGTGVAGARKYTIGFAYDLLGNLKTLDHVDSGVWSRTYYANGDLWTETRPAGDPAAATQVTATWTYDDLGRPITETYSSGEPGVRYQYDDPQVPNGIGRLSSATRQSNQPIIDAATAYDASGNELGATRTILGTTYRTGYEYDAAGHLVKITYPQAASEAGTAPLVVSYVYSPGTDALACISSGANCDAGTRYVSYSAYDALGRPSLETKGNGAVIRTRSFDGQTSALSEVNALGAAGLASWSPKDFLLYHGYGYTPASDLGTLLDYRRGSSGSAAAYTFGYDALHRLRSETVSQSSIPGDRSAIYQPSAARPHALGSMTVNGASCSYTYDASGNMATGCVGASPNSPGTAVRVTYGAFQLPASITATATGAVTSFAYDAAGDRAFKSGVAGQTVYVGPHFEIVAGVPTRYVIGPEGIVAVLTPDRTAYLETDRLGSTVAVADAAGQTLCTQSYMPFGAFREGTCATYTSRLFTGQEYDPETGLYYFGARYYNPAARQFIQPDGGIPYLYDPQALNPYAYARNNPVGRVDPDGNQDECPADMCFDAGGYRWQGYIDWWGTWNNHFANLAANVPGANPGAFNPPTTGPTSAESALDSAVARTAEAETQHKSIGQPGALESFVPVWGSLRASVDDFQNGRWGWGIFNATLAVTDVFLVKAVVTGVGKLAVKGITRVVTNRLQGHVGTAVAEFASKGYTKGQLRALAKRPGLAGAFKGERVDHFFRSAFGDDWLLRLAFKTTPRGRFGPDVVSKFPRFLDAWWDVTRASGWQKHVAKYTSQFGTNGIPLLY
jgi:RHS repeat-associated protein